MKINNFILIFLSFIILLSSCGKISEGMMGSKRSKSSDEFLVHKKKPLVVPPDFEAMPSPKPKEKEKKIFSESDTSIEELLNLKKTKRDKTIGSSDNSLEQSILKKIKKN
tara:strand:- start:202 stop:531 length:330 start_codon:yes stop_codon:yes gene_type:complete